MNASSCSSSCVCKRLTVPSPERHQFSQSLTKPMAGLGKHTHKHAYIASSIEAHVSLSSSPVWRFADEMERFDDVGLNYIYTSTHNKNQRAVLYIHIPPIQNRNIHTHRNQVCQKDNSIPIAESKSSESFSQNKSPIFPPPTQAPLPPRLGGPKQGGQRPERQRTQTYTVPLFSPPEE